jgi:dihydrofolate reductase
MDAKLVLPATLRGERDQRGVVLARDHSIARERGIPLSFRSDLHQDVKAFPCTVDRKLDSTLVVGHDATHDSQIAFANAPVFKAVLQIALRRARASAKHQPTGLAIEAMRNLRRILSEALSEQIGQRVLVVGGRWVHRQASGFVERKNVIILVKHVEEEWNIGLFERGSNEHHELAGPNTLARAAAAPIGSICTCPDDRLGARPGEPRDSVLDESIEALPGVLGCNGEGEDDRSRITTRWKRGPWTSRRP